MEKFVITGSNDKIFNLDNYFVCLPKYDTFNNNYQDYNFQNKLSDHVLMPLENTSMENISIVNCIIFGDTFISPFDVEKLLSLVRFERNMFKYTLDNFEISSFDKSIVFNAGHEKIIKTKFCKYQDMVICAKWLIQIMNKIEPNKINPHNYHILVEYIIQKDNMKEILFNKLVKDVEIESN